MIKLQRRIPNSLLDLGPETDMGLKGIQLAQILPVGFYLRLEWMRACPIGFQVR